MGLFKKKKTTNEFVPPECDHKYKDFPWYMQYFWYGQGHGIITIKEPYVCIKCKKRIDKDLWARRYENTKRTSFFEEVDKISEQFQDQLKPEPVVEDMINDMQLVDQEYLTIARSLWPERKY